MYQSFKDYLKSKEVLVEALSQTPKTTTRYIMKKYCKVPMIDNSTGELIEVSFKPKQVLVVECTWPSYQTPLVHGLFCESIGNVKFQWKNEKVLSWLEKNTKIDSWLSAKQTKDDESDPD